MDLPFGEGINCRSDQALTPVTSLIELISYVHRQE